MAFNPGVAPGELHCSIENKDYGDVLHMAMRTALVIAISHVVHLFLHRLGQPSAISQILTGIIIGPSVLGRMEYWRTNVFDPDKAHLFGAGMMIGRMVLMFLIGIEMNVDYLLRSARRAAVVAAGGIFASIALAVVLTRYIYESLGTSGSILTVCAIVVLLFANTATPVVVRIAAELKLVHSEVGRLAISASIVNGMTCMLVLSGAAIMTGEKRNGSHQRTAGAVVMLLMLAAAVVIMRMAVNGMNRRFMRRRYVGSWHAVSILVGVLTVSSVTEMMGYNNMMACFILGLFFPRDGVAARTMIDWLTYPVNNIILPVYFAYSGFHTNLATLKDKKLACVVFSIVGLSTIAKVAGTIMVTGLLHITTHEGLVLGFLLNVKGHIHLIVLNIARKIGILNYEAFTALLMTLAFNTLIAGPVAAAIVGIRRRALKFRSMGLQHHQLKSELRVLACVHSPRDTPTMLTLIEMTSGTTVGAPITAFMMHLVELTQRVATSMLYHQSSSSNISENSDDEDNNWEHGGDAARRIHHAAEAFRRYSGLKVNMLTAISEFTTMHEDVCNAAEDIKASVVLVPFHKKQRIDGKMQAWKDGVRGFNERVLRRAPCTVGILVDRGLDGTGNSGDMQALHRVVVLFFGGADDREALALGGRLAMHPCVSLTVTRFLPGRRTGGNGGIGVDMSKVGHEVQMAIPERHNRRDEDETFLAKFHDKFVATGIVTYTEEYVTNGAETVAVLRSMVESYSLFLVGKGRDGPSPLTVGMNDWEECPELGLIGDLLASSDFRTQGSVLVLQQRCSKNDDISHEFM